MLGAAGVGGRDCRVPVALRQPSRCLLTQKGCRHGAIRPHGGGAWAGSERGKQGRKRWFRAVTGTRGQRGRDPGDHGIAQVTCPRQSCQPGLQSCSHRGSSRAQCGRSEAPPSPPPPQDSCPVSKGLFAERPPGLKGQHPEPQPASCHQGPCHLC